MALQQRNSLDRRVRLFLVIFALMLAGLAGVACIGFQILNRKVETVNERWVSATQTLGELDFRIAAFRIGETYRAAAQADNERVKAEAYTAAQRHHIESLLKEYQASFPKPDLAPEPVALGAALEAYFAAHDQMNAGAFDDTVGFAGPMHPLFEAADAAIDRAVEANEAMVHGDVDAAKSIAIYAMIAVLCAAAAMLIFTSFILTRARRNISRPLASITDALAKLAAGDRDVTVPETSRADEIGTLASTFEIFRQNVLALEKAHEPTRAAQEEAQALARHDPLTGLPNRRVFFVELQTAIDRCRRRSGAYTVLLIDLDKFKSVNDLYGHPIGDLVLCETAQRLRQLVRKTDTVARLGGDEFAIVSEVDPDEPLEAGTILANRVLAAIREPIAVRQYVFEMDASIGVASAPSGETDAEGLLRAADVAMYRAKSDGRGAFRFFDEAMDLEMRLRAKFEADLRQAVVDGVIQPHYQPIIDIRDDQLWGFEILARWHHPEHGWVPPERFIPVADRLALLPKLTSCLLQRACRDALEWAASVHLSLNIAPSQFGNPSLASDLLMILEKEGFAPSRLEIEMTESALVEDVATARAILSELRRGGVQISLDDFGTGYSSLNHLREFKFDRVKIDRSFVNSLNENAESANIVKVIISLARSLGLAAVAEGIEDRSALQYLIDHGCDFGQGFIFGKAMAAGDANKMLTGELLMAG